MLLLAALFLGIFSESGFFSYAIGGKEPEKDKTEEIMLIPGGTPFGVRFYTEGALVYRLEEGSPAELFDHPKSERLQSFLAKIL